MNFIVGVKTKHGWCARSFENVPDCWDYLIDVVFNITQDPDIIAHRCHIDPEMSWECEPLVELMNDVERRGYILDWFWCAEG